MPFNANMLNSADVSVTTTMFNDEVDQYCYFDQQQKQSSSSSPSSGGKRVHFMDMPTQNAAASADAAAAAMLTGTVFWRCSTTFSISTWEATGCLIKENHIQTQFDCATEKVSCPKLWNRKDIRMSRYWHDGILPSEEAPANQYV